MSRMRATARIFRQGPGGEEERALIRPAMEARMKRRALY
jgi:hypothetical protein